MSKYKVILTVCEAKNISRAAESVKLYPVCGQSDHPEI